MHHLQGRQTVLFSATQTEKVSGSVIQLIQAVSFIGVFAYVLAFRRLKILRS